MRNFEELFFSDINQYGGNPPKWNRKFSYLLRKIQTSKSRLLCKLYKMLYYPFVERNGVEIDPASKIGAGFYLGHPYNITINPFAVIGDNCSVHKGVTIGQENRGKRKGSPILGTRVWIGVNSTVVGNILIGDDVLIAPNTFVNCDIPSHSIVIGNPCKVISKENATEGYIV